MTWEAIIALAGLGLGLLCQSFYFGRGLSKSEYKLRAYFDEKFSIQDKQLLIAVDKSRTDFGESVKAVRQHSEDAHEKISALLVDVKNVELYIRDHYVEVGSFNQVINRIEHTIDSIDGKVDKLIERK